MSEPDITAADIIEAYRHGLFPMADSAGNEDFYWYDPVLRGQLPVAGLHIPARLRRTLLSFPYEITVDTDFTGIIDLCAAKTDDRPETWINKPIRDLFIALHKSGHAHSIEVRDRQSGLLAGGLYGLAIGGAFFGESMVSRARDASKIALVHLCARLWHGGFMLLDTQFINEHLKQFGAYEVPRNIYLEQLEEATAAPADFLLRKSPFSGDEEKLLRTYLQHNRSKN